MKRFRFMFYRLSALFLFLISTTANAASERIPSGWRLPDNSELSDDWRIGNPDRYTIVRADLNGDGVFDKAMLLVSVRGDRFGLFVFLSNGSPAPEAHQILVDKNISQFPGIGIDKVASGKYSTVCGKGYRSCVKGEEPVVSIDGVAIRYFKTESASSYIYWDKKAKRFKRTWISD